MHDEEPLYVSVPRDELNQMYKDLTRLMAENSSLKRDINNIMKLCEQCMQH